VYRVNKDCLPPAELAETERALLSSPHMGDSPLGEQFINTRGFSLMFRRQALPRVLEDFPYLRPFLDAATFPHSNAFFVNPLLLSDGSRVEAHVDCRLLVEQQLRIVPTLISILYLRHDAGLSGGELVFKPGQPDAFSYAPRANDLLHFVGDLVHLVTEVQGEGSRLCVVCEQYNLPPDALAGFPEYALLRDQDLAPRVRANDH
jgi:hypothetical protein